MSRESLDAPKKLLLHAANGDDGVSALGGKPWQRTAPTVMQTPGHARCLLGRSEVGGRDRQSPRRIGSSRALSCQIASSEESTTPATPARLPQRLPCHSRR